MSSFARCSFVAGDPRSGSLVEKLNRDGEVKKKSHQGQRKRTEELIKAVLELDEAVSRAEAEERGEKPTSSKPKPNSFPGQQ